MYICVDIETTGLNPLDDRIVEIAFVGETRYYSSLVNPNRGIPPEATSVHQITGDMVLGKPNLPEVLKDSASAIEVNSGEPIIWIAHNSPFEESFLDAEFRAAGLNIGGWIDTLALAKHLWPDLRSYKNDSVRYALGLSPVFPQLRRGELAAHIALYDAAVTYAIFKEALRLKPIEELLELQKQPVLLKEMNFGKYRGRLWKDAPKDYLNWILKQDFDRDVLHTAQYWSAK